MRLLAELSKAAINILLIVNLKLETKLQELHLEISIKEEHRRKQKD